MQVVDVWNEETVKLIKEIGTNKNEVMIIKKRKTEDNRIIFHSTGQPLEDVSAFEYFGTVIIKFDNSSLTCNVRRIYEKLSQ